ncbi:MAG: hypothetical protein IJ711_01455 [Lachnospiraceae bacterium]|nr:hypothetical protein [Lachnospiraceae bacterium]
MKNIVMKGTGIYIPPNKVYNEELDEHFEKRGLKAHGLMEHLGRRKRYFISEDETPITLCMNAIDDCAKKPGISLEDIELVIVCTDTPEYLVPTTALKLVGLYGERMKNVRLGFDLNSNCSGMAIGMDVAQKYMLASGYKNALIVGCFCISPSALWDDTVVYATFADAASCVVLTAVDDGEKRRGFLDSEVCVDASYQQYITYPKCGLTKVPLKSIEPNEKRLEWIPFEMDFLGEMWSGLIRKVLERNHLEPDDIDYYVFSQLNDACNMETLRLLGIDGEGGKYHFVGKEYAYTGNTCPILCINRMWDKYAKEGNKIIICTVGAGYTAIAMLYEF